MKANVDKKAVEEQHLTPGTRAYSDWSAWWMLAALAVTFAIAIDTSGFGQSKPSADRIRQIDRLIDAMASRNKAPKIVRTSDNYQALALLSPNFDWSDQDRVRKAIQAVREDMSDEM
jgi:hypothetical protein